LVAKFQLTNEPHYSQGMFNFDYKVSLLLTPSLQLLVPFLVATKVYLHILLTESWCACYLFNPIRVWFI